MKKRLQGMDPSTHHLQQQTHTIQISLNRLNAQKSSFEHRLKTLSHTQRKARTRSLIQMGGLLGMTHFPSLCFIEEGEDLQKDVHAMDKAATLLGMLITLQDHMIPTLTERSLESFRTLGIARLKSKKI